VLELVTIGDAGATAELVVTVFDKNDVPLGRITLTTIIPEKLFLGFITKNEITIGRIDIWRPDGGPEGISAIAAFQQIPNCAGDGECCEANGTPGCNNEECCRRVCAIDPFCCETDWDSLCAENAAQFPQCGCEPPDVNFFLDAAEFGEGIAAAQKQEKLFWNFKPDHLEPGEVVPIADGLNIATHPNNAPGVWFDSLSGENLWPPEVDNVTFYSNLNPGGTLVPDDVGLAYSKAPAFNLDNNALFAEEQDSPNQIQSFAIVSGPPAGDNHTAFALELVALGGGGAADAALVITVFDKNDVQIGQLTIETPIGPKVFLGMIAKDTTIGRIDIWDLNGGWEGISAIAAFLPIPPNCPGDGPCCEPNPTAGCDNAECCRRVCVGDPFCCDMVWDQFCADRAAQFPQCGCPPPAVDLEPCPPGGCPPDDAPEWCVYIVETIESPDCKQFELFSGRQICVAPCPFPGDPVPCQPNAPDPLVRFRVVGTNCTFVARAVRGCEPCPPEANSRWNRIN
jgi:hypothetical protein